ncbi:MAG: FliO/MopB family protein [Nitrospina sp.]|jgi:flagellar protein FliO/FliZ|nr:FliO/MopB family protein [Nitrospina sp.]
MNWKKGWIFFVSLFTVLSPLSLEAKDNLSNMNRLENVETQFTEDELTIKFHFKKSLVHLQEPIFFEKSIQVDFPSAYSQPAKRFLKTGDSLISQIYVSQFNSKTMRVRFIFGKDEEGDYKNRFHMKKDGDSLVVRVERGDVDILGQLLARTTKKINKTKQINKQNKLNVKNIGGTSEVKSQPLPLDVKKMISPNSNELKLGSPKKINTTSNNKRPKWKTAKNETGKSSGSIKKISFGQHSREDQQKSEPVSLLSSGLRMVTTLSLVLGLIFLLFFGFKKYVLKNTAFGGGKLVQVLSTNFLAPKKNIALVEVAGEILVLGVSEQNISLLTSIREPDRIEEIKNAHGDNSHITDWKQGVPNNSDGQTSVAASNAANMFSRYLKQFSRSKSSKQDSVDAVTEKIRRNMGKLRTT